MGLEDKELDTYEQSITAKLTALVYPCHTCSFIKRWTCISGCHEYITYHFYEELYSQELRDHMEHKMRGKKNG